MKLVAADLGGDIWISTNGGSTWTDLTSTNPTAHGSWTAVASNATGTHLVAVGGDSIWTN
jgi:hypothetical protein